MNNNKNCAHFHTYDPHSTLLVNTQNIQIGTILNKFH